MNIKRGMAKIKHIALKKYEEKKKEEENALINRILEEAKIESNTILFESEGDFTDNARALYEYMISKKMNEKYKMIWIVDNPDLYKKKYNVYFISRKHKNKKDLIKFYSMIGSAKYLFFTHPYWYHKRNKEQVIINLWHAIPFKGKGRDLHDIFDYIIVPSNFSKSLFHDFVGSVESQYIICGYPRNDLLFKKTNSIEKIIDMKNSPKVIICMTTFKQSTHMQDSEIIYPYVLPFITNKMELSELNEELKNANIKLIIKIHHLQKTELLNKMNLSNIIYLEDKDLTKEELQLYELIGQTDALITDYSSIMFDYMLIDKPIAYFVNDLEDYKRNRGFLVDNLDDYMIGDKMISKRDFDNFILNVKNNKDEYKEKRAKFVKKMFKYKKDNCQRLLDILNIK